MADSNQVTQSGGGEGVPAESSAAVKPVEPQNTEQNVDEVKQESVEPIAESTAVGEAQPTELAPTPKVEPPIDSTAGDTLSTELAPVSQVAPSTDSIPAEVKVPTDLATAIVEPTTESAPAEVPAPSAEDTKPVSVKSVESNTELNANAQETQTTPVATPSEIDWHQREAQLLKKIEELEQLKNEKNQDGAKLLLKVREEEIDLLKARVRNLETELHAALSKPGGKNHEMIENIKQQHEELLSKARGMIFDKTKMVKNQELQIEALTTQVQSLKDINVITKDLLEIRNSEVKAMEDRLQAMEARFKAEKERYGLVLQRAQTSTTINDDLRKEYETQLAIFKELREKYEQKVKALVAENERLKASVQGGTSG